MRTIESPRFISRRQIDGRLHSVSDAVFVKDLGYNGTIVYFYPRVVEVIPHDKGTVDIYYPLQLESGRGINIFVRTWLEENNFVYNDTFLDVTIPTIIHPSRSHYNRDNDTFQGVYERLIVYEDSVDRLRRDPYSLINLLYNPHHE